MCCWLTVSELSLASSDPIVRDGGLAKGGVAGGFPPHKGGSKGRTHRTAVASGLWGIACYPLFVMKVASVAAVETVHELSCDVSVPEVRIRDLSAGGPG